MKDLTLKQLERLYNRILRRIHSERWGLAGDPYGVDLPTLALCRPGLHRAYAMVVDEAGRRI